MSKSKTHLVIMKALAKHFVGFNEQSNWVFATVRMKNFKKKIREPQ